jgi:hypothetical protein
LKISIKTENGIIKVKQNGEIYVKMDLQHLGFLASARVGRDRRVKVHLEELQGIVPRELDGDLADVLVRVGWPARID